MQKRDMKQNKKIQFIMKFSRRFLNSIAIIILKCKIKLNENIYFRVFINRCRSVKNAIFTLTKMINNFFYICLSKLYKKYLYAKVLGNNLFVLLKKKMLVIQHNLKKIICKKKVIISTISILLTFFIFIFMFQDDIFFYSYVKTLDSYEANISYIKKYPNGKYANIVKRRIDFLHYIKAKELNTITSYQSYTKEHPNGIFYNDAKMLIDVLLFEQASNINSYQKYLSMMPDGKFTKTVNKRIEELEYKEAKLNNTIESYMKYIEMYPNGRFVDISKTKIDDLLFFDAQKQNTIEAYKEYIRLQPKGRYVELSKKKIEYLDFLKAMSSKDVITLEIFLVSYPNSIYVSKIEKEIILYKFGVLSQVEFKEALHYYKIMESPLSEKNDFRTKLYYLKIFSTNFPKSKYLSKDINIFLKDHVKFATEDIPLMLQTIHHRKRCFSWLCDHTYYPKVDDYFAAKIFKDEILIYDGKRIRTIYNIKNNPNTFYYLLRKEKNTVDFSYSYNMCSTDCIAIYDKNEPLEFYESFGEINNRILNKKLENCLTDTAPKELSNKYSKTQLVESIDNTKSYFILNNIVRAVKKNPILATAAAIALYSTLSVKLSPSQATSNNYNSVGNAPFTVKFLNTRWFSGQIKSLKVDIKGSNPYYSSTKTSTSDYVFFHPPFGTYDINIFAYEQSDKLGTFHPISFSDVPHDSSCSRGSTILVSIAGPVNDSSFNVHCEE